MEPKYLLLCPQ